MEMAGLARAQAWLQGGTAYAQEHGTRPGTIGLVLSSSPLALLAWIGEKYLEWTDEDPSTEVILRAVTLYWLTDTFPRAIYFYRAYFGSKPRADKPPDDAESYCKKPMGYSYFPRELMPTPIVWAESTGNLVWSRQHDKVRCTDQISESIANTGKGRSFCGYGATRRFCARHRRFCAASLDWGRRILRRSEIELMFLTYNMSSILNPLIEPPNGLEIRTLLRKPLLPTFKSPPRQTRARNPVQTQPIWYILLEQDVIHCPPYDLPPAQQYSSVIHLQAHRVKLR